MHAAGPGDAQVCDTQTHTHVGYHLQLVSALRGWWLSIFSGALGFVGQGCAHNFRYLCQSARLTDHISPSLRRQLWSLAKVPRPMVADVFSAQQLLITLGILAVAIFSTTATHLSSTTLADCFFAAGLPLVIMTSTSRLEFLHQLYNHVALPRDVPGKEDGNLHHINAALLNRIMSAVAKTTSYFTADLRSHLETLHSSLQASQILNVSGAISKSTLIKQFHILGRHKMLVLHLNPQNCGLLIYHQVR